MPKHARRCYRSPFPQNPLFLADTERRFPRRYSSCALSKCCISNRPAAASILYERLRRLQTANVGSADPHSRAVTNGFLALINALSCVDKDQAYILASARVEETDTTVGASAKRTKRSNGTYSIPPYKQCPQLTNTFTGIAPSSSQRRRLITLADIKAEYRLEVERLGLLLNGGFFV